MITRRHSVDSIQARARRRVRVTLILVGVGLASGAASLYVAHGVSGGRSLATTRGEVSGASVHKIRGLWHHELEFRYRVSGTEYAGHESRLLRGDFKNEADALTRGTQTKLGDSVNVHFDPKTPGVARLEQAPQGFGFFAKASILWLTLALVWFVYDRSQAKP